MNTKILHFYSIAVVGLSLITQPSLSQDSHNILHIWQKNQTFHLSGEFIGQSISTTSLFDEAFNRPKSLDSQDHAQLADHELWQLAYKGTPIFAHYFSIHRHNQKLVALISQDIEDLDPQFLSLVKPQPITNAQDVWWQHQTTWLKLTTKISSSTEGQQLQLVDSHGHIHYQEPMHFYYNHQAELYPSTQTQMELNTVTLNDLIHPYYLDGSHARVFSSSRSAPRIQAADGWFDVHPEATPFGFDQVQTYYTASLVLAYFRALGFEQGPTAIDIYTNTNLYNNAVYKPAYGHTEHRIELGRGDGLDLTNLARDQDVINHELVHYVIYRHISSAAGEAGLLHEGYADYFTYARTGNPYLGETIVPGKSWLRKAEPYGYNDSRRYAPHEGGKHWAGMLWSLHEQLATTGVAFDQIVFDSIQSLTPRATLSEALLSLSLSDLKLSDTPENPHGPNYCIILEQAYESGFGALAANWDDSHCHGFTKPAPKTADAQPAPPPKKSNSGCAVLGRAHHTAADNLSLIFILLLPLLSLFKRSRHASQH